VGTDFRKRSCSNKKRDDDSGKSHPASTPPRPWSIGPQGVTLLVRLTPKGGRDAIDGIETLGDGRTVLKARVRAAPTEGEANTALLSFLSKALDVARSKMTLAAGATARIKRIVVAGDAAAIAARLEKLASD
jgi:uncharacterized protein YggU (UPF0235/DUF167 family)